MILNIHRVLGYEDGKPIAGAKIISFTGNKNQCTKQAKAWLRDHPQPIQPIYKWKDNRGEYVG